MRQFKVYFYDGSERWFNADNIGDIVDYINLGGCKYRIGQVTKIEEVTPVDVVDIPRKED